MTSRKLTRKEIREGLDHVPIDTLLLGASTGSALSPKQREFARNLALGKSKAESYREAISDKGTKKTQANAGYRLSRQSDIQAIKDAYALAIEAAKHRTPAQLRELVIHKLTEHALNEEVNPAQRIRALELLGKTAEASLFENVSIVRHEKTSADIKGRLIEQLRAITGQVIDAEPVDTSAADSLMAELQAVPSSEITDPDPHATPTDPNRPDAQGNTMHTIPHNQTPAIPPDLYPCESSKINELDVSLVDPPVRNGGKERGEGVQIPPGDWDIEDGEVAPHVK
jgi:hypothetical protein